MPKIHISSYISRKIFQIVLFTFCIANIVDTYAQQNIDASQKSFDLAKSLYDNQILLSARTAFESYISEYPNAQNKVIAYYYIASCAVKLDHVDGEVLMQSFVNNFPYHLRTKKAFLDLGVHFYASKNYKKSTEYYKLAQGNNAVFEAQNLFEYGYGHFRLKNYEDAKTTFIQIDKYSSYAQDAAYFMGFMAFENNDLEAAKNNLKEAFESENFGIEAVKMYAFILYNANEYQTLINLIDEQMSGTNDADVLKIQADAHFELKQYRLAAFVYTELFNKNRKYKTYQSHYRAGVSYLNIADLEKSIDNLKRAALSQDSLGAYASYQLGILYANEDNLLFASTSFANAAKYDTELKDEAEFLQAKMEFDLGNYDQAITHLEVFLADYPKSKNYNLANEFLSEAYLNTKNYDRAITYIESLKRLSPKTKSAYQRVTYLKGMDLYNASRYQQAIKFFKKSLTYTTDSKLEAETHYYIGESLSRGKQFKDSKFYYQEAIDSKVSPVSLLSIYGLGYAYFNLQQYKDSYQTFKNFESKDSKDLNQKYLQDVLLRMGDCAYVLKNYGQSIESYNNALKVGNKNQAYIHYQKGLVYRYDEKIIKSKNSFNVVLTDFSKSDKADDALFQISQMAFESGDYESTVSKSQKLIATFPESKYLPYALLNEAVAQNNLGNSEVSIKNYKSILNRFPRHTTANSALLGLQEFAGSGQFKEFESYLVKYKKANPKSEALENIDFETATALFYNQKYDLAISSFSKFQNEYPKSALNIDATYFLADSWFRKENSKKALTFYYKIADRHDFSKYRKIQQRIADLERELGNYARSNNYYYKLKDSKGNFKDISNSNFGLLANYFDLAKYDSAIYYGNKVLEGARISNEMAASTYLMLGKSAYSMKNYDAAVDWFVLLLNDSPDKRGAEAKYFVSKILYEKEEYKNSLQSLFTLKDEYRLFDNWVGKAFLLMADNYLALDEVFQAKATLNSLIENVKVESIKKQAKLKLADIERNELNQKADTLNLESNRIEENEK